MKTSVVLACGLVVLAGVFWTDCDALALKSSSEHPANHEESKEKANNAVIQLAALPVNNQASGKAHEPLATDLVRRGKRDEVSDYEGWEKRK